jgi:protein TonB
MILVEEYLGLPGRRLARWSSAASLVLALHVSAGVLALWYWPKAEPEDSEQSGAIMLDLPALAAESPSDQPDPADQPELTKSAPPPSPVEETHETPAETPPVEAPAPEKAVEEPPPAPVAEPLPETVKEPVPVEEAPLAPDPEVTLPKEAPAEPEKPKQEAREEKVKQKAAEKEPAENPAPKAESRQQQKAAASAKGRFDPNPVYRAKPAYPASARASKIEGYVVVSYSVSASGAVSNVRVVSASPPGVFYGATMAAVQQWRFKPSPQGAQGRRTTIRFKLK